jgi:PAS domain S-box-containing protein
LETYARTTNLAVSLTDGEGRLIGKCIHPQATWSLLQAKQAAAAGRCPFSLAPPQPCTCVGDALARGARVLARDRTGLVHFAVPLALGEHALGALVAGQVFDRYPEQLALEHVAEKFGLPPGEVWQRARREYPVKQATLEVYGDLLATLGNAFLRTRYHTLLEAHRLAEMTRLRDLLLQLNGELQKFKFLSDNASDAHHLLDPEARFLYVNKVACERLGYSEQELLKLSLPDIDLLYSKERVQELFEHSKTEKVPPFEAIHRRKDGSTFPVEINIMPVELEGEPYLFANARDITERKRFEAQLRHTQKLESLGVLAGGVAHDFNNLLTGMLGNASLALNTLATWHPARARLEQVILASQRAAELTNQLLAYSGRGHFLIQPVRLSELVSEISQLIRTSMARTVQLHLELDEGLPPVEADGSQIQQLVMNLVLNAAEAVGEGTGTVWVRTGLQELDEAYLREALAADGISPGPYVYLEVQDGGCGMTEEVRSKIFDPFFTTKLTGRGLGLAAVLGIVRGHRGAIQVDSAPGEGTTFKVLLPAAASREAEPRAESPLSDLTGTGTLLVVDDEELIRRLAKDVLEGYGYQVLEAANGREAVELFRQQAGQIAGVLLDLTMPVMGGEEALRQLKEILPEVRVVLSSGYDEADTARRFAGEGLADFIQKPYSPVALATKIKKALAVTISGRLLH